LYRKGIEFSDKWGSNTQLLSTTADRDFSASSHWTNNSMATYDETGDLSVTSTAAGQYCYIALAWVPFTVAKRYRLTVTVSAFTGQYFYLQHGSTNQTIGVLVTGVNVFEWVVTRGFNTSYTIKVIASGTGGITLDDFSVIELGATLALTSEGMTQNAWIDGSDNHLDATWPTEGYYFTRPDIVHMKEVVIATSRTVLLNETFNSIITNYGQAAVDVIVQLPTAGPGMRITAVMGTTQVANTWKLKAATNDKIYLYGVAGTDNQSVIITPTVGDGIKLYAFQTGATSWDWQSEIIEGVWTAGA
jgi:hypothetical protein